MTETNDEPSNDHNDNDKNDITLSEGLDELLAEQWFTIRLISQVVVNYRKLGKDKFSATEFDEAADVYEKSMDELSEMLAKQTNGSSFVQRTDPDETASGHESYNCRFALPRIKVPPFDGNAALLIAHVQMSDANYDGAWKILKDEYDCSRALITAYINAFAAFPAMKTESASDLKRLRDTVNSSLSALRNLKRPVNNWADLLVYIVVQKFSAKTRREWNIKLGASNDYPTFDRLLEFINERARGIAKPEETPEISSSRVSSEETRNKSHASVNTTVTNHVLNCVATPDVDALLRKFWEVEEVPQQPIQSPEDAHCESFFAKTISRTPSGRYIVRLPFRGDTTVAIGESRAKALRLYHRTEDRLAAQPHVAVEYNKFLSEYETLGHMERVEVPDTSLRSVYLPHHLVFKEGSQTSNLRVVFNASCNTSNGTSLNDHLLSGPKLQLDIAAVILRWRRHRFVYRADIAKMFRQILVSREDADYQRIFWRPLNSPTVLPFRLLTVTYGTAPAPFFAMRVLRQLADDDEKEFPEAVEVLRHSIYVDNVLFGADELSEAR
ncbi:hypothetical protein RF55_16198, partial [Lasius niger]